MPEGSRALAGIGCHFMAQWMDRDTQSFTQMGGEGATWLGQAPFSKTPHVFQNLGDGTYYHSGSLAIRAAVAANVNITYKLLYNDAVAMTGGQPVDGPLDVPIGRQSARAPRASSKIAIVTDEPEKYPTSRRLPGRASKSSTATGSTMSSARCARRRASPPSSTTRPARRRSAAGASAA